MSLSSLPFTKFCVYVDSNSYIMVSIQNSTHVQILAFFSQ